MLAITGRGARQLGPACDMKPGGLLMLENLHQDINGNTLAGRKLGHPVNDAATGSGLLRCCPPMA